MSNILSIENSTNHSSSVYACKPSGDTTNPNNGIPGMMNNTVVGIPNMQDGQRIMQREMFESMAKINEKSDGSSMMSACGNNYVELSQEQVQGNGNIVTLARSESVRSEAGESCSSLSSGDSQNDCPSNILIMPGQIPPNVHGQHINNHNQIVLNQNAMNQLRSTGNIVITNNQNGMLPSQMENGPNGQNGISNFQIMNSHMAQHSMTNHNMSMMSQHMMSSQRNVNTNVMDNQNGPSERREGLTEHGKHSFECNSVGVEGMMRQGMGMGMEGEMVIVNNMPHQLVRTPAGIMLSMLPAGKQSVVGSSVSVGVVNSVASAGGNNAVQSFVPSDGRQVTVPSQPQVIVIPFGWNRIVDGYNVYYIR